MTSSTLQCMLRVAIAPDHGLAGALGDQVGTHSFCFRNRGWSMRYLFVRRRAKFPAATRSTWRHRMTCSLTYHNGVQIRNISDYQDMQKK